MNETEIDSQLEKLDVKVKDQKRQQINLAIKIKENEEEIKSLKKKKESLKAQRVKDKYTLSITDHAVIRYLERNQGIDTGLIRQMIDRESNLEENLNNILDGKLPMGKGYFVIEQRTIVTYIVKEGDKK